MLFEGSLFYPCLLSAAESLHVYNNQSHCRLLQSAAPPAAIIDKSRGRGAIIQLSKSPRNITGSSSTFEHFELNQTLYPVYKIRENQ